MFRRLYEVYERYSERYSNWRLVGVQAEIHQLEAARKEDESLQGRYREFTLGIVPEELGSVIALGKEVGRERAKRMARLTIIQEKLRGRLAHGN